MNEKLIIFLRNKRLIDWLLFEFRTRFAICFNFYFSIVFCFLWVFNCFSNICFVRFSSQLIWFLISIWMKRKTVFPQQLSLEFGLIFFWYTVPLVLTAKQTPVSKVLTPFSGEHVFQVFKEKALNSWLNFC